MLTKRSFVAECLTRARPRRLQDALETKKTKLGVAKTTVKTEPAPGVVDERSCHKETPSF
ncbi:hypothetical protein DVH24_027965 [Malus domestica]|uniref:Uncharacterized protein n=1 Tax=Malus domestica TaxID=3750 RepID=A0A498H8T2_MALDO|nr:hypothetical protein DVH24_027965 [Malus domestica]